MQKHDLELFVARALAQGEKLETIQTRLAQEHDEHLTFMELRLLAAELENIDWKQFDAPEPPSAAPEQNDAEIPAMPEEQDLPGAAQTRVELSPIVRAGAMFSGSVMFKSGASGQWYLTQDGQLGLENVKGTPNAEDKQEFMLELQNLLSRA